MDYLNCPPLITCDFWTVFTGVESLRFCFIVASAHSIIN
jgi:hypothetical protein